MGIKNSKCYYCKKDLQSGEEIIECMNCHNISHQSCFILREKLITNINCIKCKKITMIKQYYMN